MPVESRTNSTTARFSILALLVCLLTLAVFFRDFFQSGCNGIAGDVGDNRFVIAILEHWRAVFHGEASFTSPNFFWPERGVLGYSESLFLLSLPYIAGRSAGLDHYLAFEITFIVFKAAGFFAMLWLLRSMARVSRAVALIGAVLFTLSNLYYVSMGHAHLVTVAFTPLIAGLACSAWRAYGSGRLRAAHAYGAACAIVTALVLFTSFYIGWFTILTAGSCVAVAALVQILIQKSVTPVSDWLRAAFARRWLFGSAGLVFAGAMIPFLVTYVPTLRNTGGRTFSENLLYSTRPIDLLNVGPRNFVWGRLLKSVLAHPFTAGERMAGWPPIVLLLTIGGGVAGAAKLSERERRDTARYGTQVVVFGASFLGLWVLTVRVGRWSLWWLIFKAVPGGSAIRVPARLNFVLNVLLVLSACLIFEQLRYRRGRIPRLIFPVLGVLLVAEQINITHTHVIDRTAENAILARVKRPPVACSSFAFTAPARTRRPFPDQIDAMLVARGLNLPTINGYSGWLPQDWNFPIFDKDYLDHARRWAFIKNVEQGLCGLDLRDGSWSTIASLDRTYRLGDTIDFRKGGNATNFEGQGWGGPEPWGAWTVGDRSVLALQLPSPPTSDLAISIEAEAFTPPQRSRADETLLVNGSVAAHWSITSQEPVLRTQVRLPAGLLRSGVVRIEFINHDPRSPADLGLSADDRKISLGIHTLRVDAATR